MWVQQLISISGGEGGEAAAACARQPGVGAADHPPPSGDVHLDPSPRDAMDDPVLASYSLCGIHNSV
jgi:hypothetical protein